MELSISFDLEVKAKIMPAKIQDQIAMPGESIEITDIDCRVNQAPKIVAS